MDRPIRSDSELASVLTELRATELRASHEVAASLRAHADDAEEDEGRGGYGDSFDLSDEFPDPDLPPGALSGDEGVERDGAAAFKKLKACCCDGAKFVAAVIIIIVGAKSFSHVTSPSKRDTPPKPSLGSYLVGSATAPAAPYEYKDWSTAVAEIANVPPPPLAPPTPPPPPPPPPLPPPLPQPPP